MLQISSNVNHDALQVSASFQIEPVFMRLLDNVTEK